MLGGRQDVELLAAVGAMPVTHEPELLEDVERAVHRRRGRPGSRARQRSTSSAPVTWPSDAASTSMTVRRWGVQRRPRSAQAVADRLP